MQSLVSENILFFNSINWNYLEYYSIEDAYNNFILTQNILMDMYIQPNMVTILARYLLRDPWMTSSHTSPKLFHKCMKKIRTDHAHINYIKYKNVYNTVK